MYIPVHTFENTPQITFMQIHEDLPGVQSANTSYIKQMVDVVYHDTQINEKALTEAVHKAGYTAISVSEKAK